MRDEGEDGTKGTQGGVRAAFLTTCVHPGSRGTGSGRRDGHRVQSFLLDSTENRRSGALALTNAQLKVSDGLYQPTALVSVSVSMS